MGYSFTIRNKGSGVYVHSETSGGAPKMRRKTPSGVVVVDAVVVVETSVCQRPRPSGPLCSLLKLERSTVGCGGGCRWIYGALGSKGRQEGGQYRAGRRAPPAH